MNYEKGQALLPRVATVAGLRAQAESWAKPLPSTHKRALRPSRARHGAKSHAEPSTEPATGDRTRGLAADP